jgi:hypothetical protein
LQNEQADLLRAAGKKFNTTKGVLEKGGVLNG